MKEKKLSFTKAFQSYFLHITNPNIACVYCTKERKEIEWIKIYKNLLLLNLLLYILYTYYKCLTLYHSAVFSFLYRNKIILKIGRPGIVSTHPSIQVRILRRKKYWILFKSMNCAESFKTSIKQIQVKFLPSDFVSFNFFTMQILFI